jgi:hypothetical protein
MNAMQFKTGRIKMNSIKKLNNLISVRPLSILIIPLCLGLLLSCSGGDVNGPEFNISTDGFNFNDQDFTAGKIFIDDLEVDNHIRVTVAAVNGEVVVTGQSGAQQVKVTAHLYVTSDSQEDAELHLDDLDILVADDANEILIQTVQPQNFNGREYRVEYDIIVPDRFEVVTSQVNGAIAILDIQNNIDVWNENGDIMLSGVIGGVTAHVENGRIDGSVVLPVNEGIDLSVINGGLDLSIPKSTSAVFSATIDMNGEIIMSDLEFTESTHTPVALTGTLGNGEGFVVLSTVNGNIEIMGFD